MEDFQQLNELLNYHLKQSKIIQNYDDTKWYISESSLHGRGLFARTKIQPGELVLVDHPLLLGPRSKITLHCVICARVKNIKPCSKGCGLPVCSLYCELSIQHLRECEIIRKLLKCSRKDEEKFAGDISVDIFRALTALRSLLLEDKLKKLILHMARHDDPKHGYEIELVKKHLIFEESQETFLKNVCGVLDANAFETVKYVDEKNRMSLKGLYPLSAIMNHSCIPNTVHCFDKDQNMMVRAATVIEENEEIFTTYTSLLWGTTSRRHHLASTKHFWCNCSRCSDPKEFDSCLSALKCILRDCSGMMLPENSLDIYSKWICDACELQMPCKKIGIIQSSLGGLLKSIDVTDLGKLMDFLKNRLGVVVPSQNQIAVEMKFKIIWTLGNTAGYFWKDLSTNNLNFKHQLCEELINLCNKLKLGNCTLRGQILYELFLCLQEKCNRLPENERNTIENETQNVFLEAVTILKDDITAPREIRDYVHKMNNNFLNNHSV